MSSRLKILSLFSIIAFVSIAAIEHAYYRTPIIIPLPEKFPAVNELVLKNNPPSLEGFELGRKLFYDGRLSRDGATSCGNCHQQAGAFSTIDHDFSHGIDNEFTTRNSPGLFNLLWRKDWHWDGGVLTLEAQPLHPLTAKNEMGSSLDTILPMMRRDTVYQRMFREAFANGEINTQNFTRALTQFMALMISAGSKYDRVMAGKATFTEFESNGYELFKANCAECHREPLFTDDQFRNVGVPLGRLPDFGRMAITNTREDSLKFRVPTLRNVQVTFPYMHDGRIYSVPRVLDHYMSLDTTDILLDPILRRKKIRFTAYDKMYLTQFLYTLTDSTFLLDKRFGPPSPIVVKH